jgi:mono/diheme cytochrome c family protein
MPAFDRKLSREQIHDVVRYIRSLSSRNQSSRNLIPATGW